MMFGRNFYGGGYNGNYGGGAGGYNSFRSCFGYGFGGDGLRIMVFTGILILAAVLIYILVHNRRTRVSNSSALEILKMKYVQGEMSEEEYLRRKDLLER